MHRCRWSKKAGTGNAAGAIGLDEDENTGTRSSASAIGVDEDEYIANRSSYATSYGVDGKAGK